PDLGLLTHDKNYDWWNGTAELRAGLVIELRLLERRGTDAECETDELLRRGADFLAWARSAEPSVKARIADELLETYNDFWASEDEGGIGRLSRERFLEQIEASSITFDPDGSAFWYYSDGDLFAGHWIEVRIDPDRQISEVGLAG